MIVKFQALIHGLVIRGKFPKLQFVTVDIFALLQNDHRTKKWTLKACIKFMIAAVLDTDPLLENDLVTLDEALRTSNNTVLMAMNAISIIISVCKLWML